MAVKLRLKKMGRRNRPCYRIVAIDSRAPRGGKTIEILGHYDPLPENATMVVKKERAEYWLSKGAQPSETVLSILRKSEVDIPIKTKRKKRRNKKKAED